MSDPKATLALSSNERRVALAELLRDIGWDLDRLDEPGWDRVMSLAVRGGVALPYRGRWIGASGTEPREGAAEAVERDRSISSLSHGDGARGHQAPAARAA